MLARLFRSLRTALDVRRLRVRVAPVNADTGWPDAVCDDGDAVARQASEYFLAGRFAEARPYFEQMLARAPYDVDTQFRLGVIYGACGLLQKAEQILDRAAEARPDSIDILNARANIAWLMSAWPVAVGRFKAITLLAPGNATLWANFGLCLHDAGRLDEAADALRHALEIDAEHPDALVNAALVRLDLGDTDAARVLILRALKAAPEFPEAHALYAQLLLQDGEFAEGWREYEWRLRCQGVPGRDGLQLPIWKGQTDHARALIVHAEQGLGDQIMFASCLGEIVSRVGHCEVECDPRLVGLFGRSFPSARFHPCRSGDSPSLPAVPVVTGCQIALGSLPQFCRNAPGDFPAHRGYLKPESLRKKFWSAELAKLGAGIKIGIAWRGGVARTRQTMRSIPLQEWLPLLRMRGSHFVSLQHGDCTDEIAAVNACLDVKLMHWQDAIDDYDETAALVAALDVVVSVCGSIVHLAGAIGTPACVMVPVCPEWRYMRTGDSMPWYPQVRLFRQAARGEWKESFDRIADYLESNVTHKCQD